MSMILTDVRLFAGGADLTGQSNKVEISAEVEDKDATNYASEGWKEVLGGLASATVSGAGQWEAGDPGLVDDAAWAQLSGRTAWTVCPSGAVAVGDLAYFTRALHGSYKLGDAVGEIAPWEAEAKSAWPLVRGALLHLPGTARTAGGEGTALELGPVPAGKRLYAALHVLSVAGTSSPSLTARIESDVDADFADPATVLTFTPATQPGAEILRTTGDAISDGFFRLSWDITGTSPSFMLAAVLGLY